MNSILPRIFALGFCALFSMENTAAAAEVKALVTIAMKEVFDELAPRFERASGHKLAARFALAGVFVKEVEAGEYADVIIVPRPAIDGLAKAGKIAQGSISVIARSGVGVAVRKGSLKPDISTPGLEPG